jgi:hypothetical protein
MAKSAIERLQASRQSTVESVGKKFIVRRPTHLEMDELRGHIDQRDLLTRFVVGWGTTTEIDLGIPSGSPEPVEFDNDLWAEWIADHPEHWIDITKAVVDGYRAYAKKMEDSAKNSQPGSPN